MVLILTHACAGWMNHSEIFKEAITVSAHSSFNMELQAIKLAMQNIAKHKIKRVILLIDNEVAAKSIWDTKFHNLQAISIDTMIIFHKWTVLLETNDFQFNISWCPAHMDVYENEFVDSLANDATIDEEFLCKSTLLSKIEEFKCQEYDIWDSNTRQHNTLGHEYLRLKFKGKCIRPMLGSRRNAFIIASKDNITL
ncbi:hypothetical protein AX15_001190 [Amanita polypyramis BW_CC]|nr:hypothetical protein AX15_001190 [Amanita polypyramis BW_CC]